MACFNPLLAEQRRRKRDELLAATQKLLEKIAQEVARRTKKIMSKSQIGMKVGRAINRYKMAKHFQVTIGEGSFSYQRRVEQIEREKQMDGIYVVRTSEPAERLSPADTVRGYKDLAQVERAFRSLKGGGPAGAADLPADRGSRQGPHPPVPAGLLRGVAHAAGAGAALVRG